MSRSRAAYARAIELLPGGVNSPVRAFRRVGGDPIYFRSGSGSRCIDLDGNAYADYCLSWGPLIHGHASPTVVEAVRRAAADGLSFGACHERELELAELVLGAVSGRRRMRAVSSGTEAVMTAVRIARAATGRELVVKFDGGYHGHADGMLVKAGSGLATQAIADSAGVPKAVAATTVVVPFDDDAAIGAVFAEFGSRIAAVVIEPLPANNGLLVQRPEYLRLVASLARSAGALLVLDEVISGFRLRYGSYAEGLGLDADLLTFGKVIGGGMPLGAVAGAPELMDLLAPDGAVYQAGTLSGNPLSMAAGIAALQALRDDPPYERLERLGAGLDAAIAGLGRGDVQIRRAGSIAWLYLASGELPRRADGIDAAAVERFGALHRPLLERGHYLPPSAYEVLFLCTEHAAAQVEALAADLGELLQAAEA
ncbi:MAG: glutamate-1-semialdehyde 2,1-aminomutase [Spirochaetaceae bacterium]|nr:glutamate-1-semialdehyde 2,1-aminomutase [Spirochaetaceae bacterium]